MSFGPKSPIDEASTNTRPDRHWKRLGLTICVVLSLFAVYYPFSPGAVQQRNMREADSFVPAVVSRIGDGPRFEQVHVQVTTAELGALLIIGYVRSEQDLASLKTVVASGPLPKNVAWRIQVIPPEQWVDLFSKPTQTVPTTYQSVPTPK
jgi:hypothetical protein